MPNNSPSNEDLILIKWLHIHRPDLVEKAQQQQSKDKSNIARSFSLVLLQFLLSVIWAKAEEFDGNAIKSDETVQQAQLTSGVGSGATLFNAITNWPILLHAFRTTGPVLAFSLSIVLNLIILWWTNQSGTTGASRKHGNKLWSAAGIMAFIAISAVQSVVAGVGAELSTNQNVLAQNYATQLVNEQRNRLDDIVEEYEDELERQHSKCDAAVSRLNPDSATYDSDWERLNGQTWDQKLEGKPPTPGTICGDIFYIGEKLENTRNNYKEALENFLNTRQKSGRDLDFIQVLDKEQNSNIYKDNFEEIEEGVVKIRNGATAIKLASESFWSSVTINELEAYTTHTFSLPYLL